MQGEIRSKIQIFIDIMLFLSVFLSLNIAIVLVHFNRPSYACILLFAEKRIAFCTLAHFKSIQYLDWFDPELLTNNHNIYFVYVIAWEGLLYWDLHILHPTIEATPKKNTSYIYYWYTHMRHDIKHTQPDIT